MKTTMEILNALRAAGYQVWCGEVRSKNGKDVLGEIVFSHPYGRVSRLEEGIRYTVEDEVNGEKVRWTVDRTLEEGKPDHKVVRRVLIHNHLANS